MTNATQEAFKENAAISKKIAQLVDEIATASEEQSHGISQINKAVAELDKVTQQTAASAEPTRIGLLPLPVRPPIWKNGSRWSTPPIGSYTIILKTPGGSS